MGLKSRYRQTEIGVLPEDWGVESIEHLASITTGSKDTQDRIEDGEYPFFVRSQTVECIDSYSFDGEAVLTAGDGVGTGKVFHYINGKFDVHQRVYRISEFDECLSGYFFYLYFSTKFYNRIMQMTAKSSVDSVRRDMIARMMVPLPRIEEQELIANTLRDGDALLEGLDRLIAKKRDLKQATMQELLTGETRLPGFSGAWQTVSLANLGTFLKGKGIKRDDVSDVGTACIRYGEIYTYYNDYITNPRSRISRDVADKALPLKHGDLLFAGSGETAEEIGSCAAYLADEEAYAGGDIVVLRLSGQSSLYLGHLLNHRVVAEQKARLGQGDAVVHISARNLARVVVKLPPIDEQEAIARVLSDMDTEIEALEQRRAKTVDLKQAMMQELLTGKTRLVGPHASEAEEASVLQSSKGHNWAFNEAVVISALVNHFGSENYPLGRKRYTKLAYLLHRHAERKAEGYLKKAAGPYNPQTRYGGPEKIAKENGYIKQHKGPKGHSGFVAADNIAQAEGYFEEWYGADVLQWLEQFRRRRNDDLEVLTTVDMAVDELRFSGLSVDIDAVKDVISSHPEWEAKLERPVFSDVKIAEAIEQSEVLFGAAVSGGTYA